MQILELATFGKALFLLSFLFFCCKNTILFSKVFDSESIERNNIKARQLIESERKDLIRKQEKDWVKGVAKEESKDIPDKKSVDNFNANCRIIKKFTFVGNKKISKRTLENFIDQIKKGKQGLCFAKEDFSNIYSKITNYYIEKGYIIARVYFDFVKISQEEVFIIVEEGKLNNLDLIENRNLKGVFSFQNISRKFFAFPFLSKDDIVNIRDIEQGIDQINRLSSQSAKIILKPADEYGYSDIIVNNKIEHPFVASFAVDNSGQKNTGKIKHKVSLNYDNLLAVSDNIYLHYSESNAIPLFGSNKEFNSTIGIVDNSNNRYSKAFYSNFSIPFGYSTIGGSYSYSKYLLTTSGIASQVKSSGNSETKSYYFDHVLSRGKNYKTSIKIELEENDTDSYVEDTYIPINSRKTSEVSIFLNNNIYFPMGSLYIQPKYVKGLKLLDAMQDSNELAKDKPRAQFESFGLYSQSNVNFTIPKVLLPLNHKLTLDVLKSKDSLYGVNQMSIGGKYSVRGFQESIISGDNGYLIRNDLTINAKDIFLRNSTKKDNINSFIINSAIAKLNLGLFYDYGYTRNNVVDNDNDKGHMSGAGVSLSFNNKIFNWELIYAKSLHSPRHLRNFDNISEDNETIYFSFGVSLAMF